MEAFIKDGFLTSADFARGAVTVLPTPDLDADRHVIETTAYSDDYFFSGGAGYSDYLGEENLLRDRGQWYAELLNRQTRRADSGCRRLPPALFAKVLSTAVADRSRDRTRTTEWPR